MLGKALPKGAVEGVPVEIAPEATSFCYQRPT
jgi:hypothetical protein